jgi:hypothetical protein
MHTPSPDEAPTRHPLLRFTARQFLSTPQNWHNLPELMWSLFKEFLKFCKQEKKWWLIPLIVLLLLLGVILLFTASSGIAWALYPFM